MELVMDINGECDDKAGTPKKNTKEGLPTGGRMRQMGRSMTWRRKNTNHESEVDNADNEEEGALMEDHLNGLMETVQTGTTPFGSAGAGDRWRWSR